MKTLRLWKHLKMLKRGGIGLLPGGIDSAMPGSCAIECPACPQAADANTDESKTDAPHRDNEPADAAAVNPVAAVCSTLSSTAPPAPSPTAPLDGDAQSLSEGASLEADGALPAELKQEYDFFFFTCNLSL